jgi:ankyrin repeat protein
MPRTPKSRAPNEAIAAIEEMDVDKLRELLASGLNPSSTCASAPKNALHMIRESPILFHACQMGDAACVRALLEARADATASVDCPDTLTGKSTAVHTALNVAAISNKPPAMDCIMLLVGAGADVNAGGRAMDGCTELMLACQDGKELMARFLLDHRADPNACKHNGSGPLFKAAQGGHAHILRLLIHAQANIEARFHSGCTPLGAAACSGHVECARLLLNAGARLDVVAKDGHTPKSMAEANGAAACVRLMEQARGHRPPSPALAAGASVSVEGLSARPELNGAEAIVLDFDPTNGRYSVALFSGQYLSLKPANLRSRAAEAGAAAGAASSGVPVRLEDLMEAMRFGQPAYFESLLSRREVDPNGSIATGGAGGALGSSTTLLISAAGMMRVVPKPSGVRSEAGQREGVVAAQPEYLRALLSHGARADVPSAGGATALMVACQHNLLSHVQLLLEHAADVNAATASGTTPLMECGVQAGLSRRDHSPLPCIEALFACGQTVAVDATDAEGYSALATAVEHNELDIVAALIERGASVNVEVAQRPGYTPLAVAVSGETKVAPQMVRILLEGKADPSLQWQLPSAPHRSARTSEAWASALCNHEAVRFFREHSGFDENARRLMEAGMPERLVDGLTDKIASGELTEAAATRQLVKMGAIQLAADQGDQLRARRQGSVKAALEACGLGGGGAHSEAADGALHCTPARLPEPSAAAALPDGPKPVYGGLCRVQGLQKAAELNGQVGRVLSWNEDGRRRFGVRLHGSGKCITVQARNLVPEEDHPFPSDFQGDSAAFCARLQAGLAQLGSEASTPGARVLDWTEAVGKAVDVVHCLYVAAAIERATMGDTCVYVQNTPETAPFFLAHRELILPDVMPQGATAVPWVLMNSHRTTMPSSWAKSCHTDYMLRLCLHHATSTSCCSVCLEEKTIQDHPSQLPCAHFCCIGCVAKLHPPSRSNLDITGQPRAGIGPDVPKQSERGMTCPVCRTHFPTHFVTEHAAVPGGMAIVEYL